MVTTTTNSASDQLGINVIRGLSLDGPHAANSGHQGTAMALAPLAHTLFTRVLRYDAADTTWPDRDRLILSAGHASILLYSMLYLTNSGSPDQPALELDDLEAFRQFDSATPGHPEAGHTAGVEVTTGPLGQGFANGVGMAIAERNLRARFGSDVTDHFTFVIAGDGCLSEGISHEAASLAGHLGLGRLVVIYDDNHITIDGPTEMALDDNPSKRFEAYNWHVIEAGEIGEDVDALEQVLNEAKAETDRPTLIRLRTHIGTPSPSLTDDHAAHGLAFGAAEISEVKAVMGIPDEPFWVPDEVIESYRKAGLAGSSAHAHWQDRYGELSDELKAEWDAAWSVTGLDGWEDALPEFERGTKMATRKASQKVLDALVPLVPGLIGGSADLTGNTGTVLTGQTTQSAADPAGRQIYFGVREHAMGAALVGMAKHGGLLPLGGTFLVFSDYMRPAVRLAALSGAQCVFVWTHDSLGVGEDGPTHQPVEQLMSLRAIPGLQVIRPADAVETAGAWQLALDTDGPTAIILSRQDLPVLDYSSIDGVAQGAYLVADHEAPEVTLVGTGSEVSLCLEAAAALDEQGIGARVVSMPCWNAYEALSIDEQDDIISPDYPSISVEAGVTLGWERHADLAVGIDRFGASAPGSVALANLGMNVENIVGAVNELLDAIED